MAAIMAMPDHVSHRSYAMITSIVIKTMGLNVLSAESMLATWPKTAH